MNFTRKLAAAFAATALAAGAQAATVYANDFGNVDTITPGSISTSSFGAGGGAATVGFVIDGFNTLDGQNSYEDIFTLSVNGVAVTTGSWDLGGGGASGFLSGASGATWAYNATSAAGVNRSITVAIPVSLLAGSNTLTFSYDSPTAGGLAGPQGLGDEGWGLGQVTVTSAVPEPASAALLLAGLGLVGGIARRRARSQA